MKRLVFLILFLNAIFAQAQTQNRIHVSGSAILGPCNDTLLLRGVNYAPYNWGWSPTELLISQIALSGSNTVRLVWYKTGATGTPATTYANLTLLDSALSKCIQNKLIPVIDLHDQTCANNPTALITLANWFTQPAVLALINKYKHSLILNLANEALYVMWLGNTQAAKNTFITTYTTIVNNLRTQNITVPLMIDAPDCGQHLDFLADAASTLLNNDPEHNLIFSAHAYWYSYASNDSTQMLNKINYALSKNIPFVLGEIANQQDNTTNCQYNLNYQALLNICQQKKVGWYAWSWNNDVCPQRCMSTNGQFNALTAYGTSLLYHANFGLLTHTPAKSHYLMYGNCQQRMNLSCLLQSYLNGANSMYPVLYQQGIVNTTSLPYTDTIEVSLYRSNPPYVLLGRSKSILKTDGTSLVLFPDSTIAKSAYIGIKHRNHIETWSAQPQVVLPVHAYNFTTSAVKAYGSNQANTGSGFYAFHTGDLNQDAVVDGLDYNEWEQDNNQFATGYLASDLNGDGIVDGLDFLFWEPNNNLFIGSSLP